MKLILNEHPLLTYSVLESLRRKSVFNVADLLASDFNDICSCEKINLRTLYKIREHYLNKVPTNHTNGLLEYERVLQESFIVSTNDEALDEATEGGFYSGELNLLIGHHISIDSLCYMIDRNASQALISTGGQFEMMLEESFSNDDKHQTSIVNISDIFDCFEVIEELREHINISKSVKLVIVSCVNELLKPLTNVKLKSELGAKIHQLTRVMRRLCECNVCCLLCTCDDESMASKNITEALVRQVDNVIRLSDLGNHMHSATIVKSNKTAAGAKVFIKSN